MIKLFLVLAAAALAAAGCSAEPSGLPSSGLVVPARGSSSDAGPEAGDEPSAPPDPEPAGGEAGDAAASPGEDAGDTMTALGVARCGEPPFRMVRLGARDMMGASGAPDLAGVTITLGHCPGLRFETGADGGLMLLVSRSATSWIRFDKPGHVSWLVGELIFDDTLPPVPVTGTMIPTKLAASVVPGLRPDGALVYVEVQGGLAAGPEACRSPGGVTLSVKDHPQAVVLYRAAGSNAGYDKAAMTSEEGLALIGGLPASGSVELVATKAGCQYSLAYGDVNSRALIPILRTPLAAGTITHQVFNPVRH